MAFIHSVGYVPNWLHQIHPSGRGEKVAVTVGSKVFIFVSDPVIAHSMLVFAFDTNDYSWKLVSKKRDDRGTTYYPKALYNFLAVVHRHKVWVLGYLHDLSFSGRTIHRFNTQTFRWCSVRTGGKVPRGEMFIAACQVEGKLYLFTSFSDDKKSVYCLDLDTKVWSRICKIRGREPLIATCAVPLGKKIFVLLVCWVIEKDAVYRTAYFDTETNTWEYLKRSEIMPPYKLLLRYETFVLAGDVYAVGCCDFEPTRTFSYRYCPTKSLWSVFEPQGLLGLYDTSSAVGNRVFFFNLPGSVRVLVLRPTLRELCLANIRKHNQDIKYLPPVLQKEVLEDTE